MTRDKDYLNWRFFQKPGLDYKCFEHGKNGYIVVDTYQENGEKQLQIVDIIANSEEVFFDLVEFAVFLAYEWECNIVKLWSTSKLYYNVLKEAGFLYGQHPFPMTIWNDNINISESYITMADSDIF